MIYLTFDSNIWIYSLDDSWRVENHLDYLEPWINEGLVKFLIPEIILKEWGKHRQEQVEVRVKKLKDFFDMAEEILPSSFYSDYLNPTTQKGIIDLQLDRIDKLLKSAEVIPLLPEVEKKVLECGIQKKAPLHSKSSVADAIIVFSLIDYVEKNNANQFFFISNNTSDFYEKGNIHPDLKPDFERLNIKPYRNLNQLINELQKFNGLKVDENISTLRKERIKLKIKEIIYNPEYEKITADQSSSYIINLNTIEYILKQPTPTKEQVIFVLALIDNDTALEREFYNRLENKAWFKILKNKGVFDYKNNPTEINVDGGTQLPYWLPLIYLEKLSTEIVLGIDDLLAKDILEFIKNVSENPKDNHRTWYGVTKILNNLPNELILASILDFIPIWLGSKNDLLVSSQICDRLLPKFLSDNPTEDDLIKSRIILSHLFNVYKVDNVSPQLLGAGSYKFKTLVNLQSLKHAFEDSGIINKVAKFYKNDFVFEIANIVKKVRFFFSSNIEISLSKGSIFYLLKAEVAENELNIYLLDVNNNYSILGEHKINDFEKYSEKSTRKMINSILYRYKISSSAKNNRDEVDSLIYKLLNGTYYDFSGKGIGDLNRHMGADDTIEVLSTLIIRDLILEKAKRNINEVSDILNTFVTNPYYRLPIFRRIVFYIIGLYWKEFKNIFWNIIKIDNTYFTDEKYKNELFDLLSINQYKLTKKELNELNRIIKKGPIDNRDLKYHNVWRLQWYSALKDTSTFKVLYDKFSNEYKLDYKHFKDSGKVKIRTGSVSPVTTDEFIKMTNIERVKFINNFKPNYPWDETSIDGLSNILEKAVELNPQSFTDNISVYNDLSYIYSYRFFNGFKAAWIANMWFNWSIILDFCINYINNPKFYSEQLKLDNDGWSATSDWSASSISQLLSEGMRTDSHSFELELMPKCKAIIFILIKNLKPANDFEKTNMDYLTYSLNSNAGKALMTLLEYSLRITRNVKLKESQWDLDVKKLFEVTLSKFIDGYILLGRYFAQFSYLDKKWTEEKVIEFYNAPYDKWFPFMSGYTFGNPIYDKSVYLLFYPHFERAILNDVEFKYIGDSSLVRHIAIYYFWDFESLENDGLIKLFLGSAKSKSISEFVGFIWRQEDYYKYLEPDEKIDFELKILNLWLHLSDRYLDTAIDEEQVVLAEITNLLVFSSKLNNQNTELVLRSSKFLDKSFNTHYLIENLIKLKDKGEFEETLGFIGQILLSLEFEATYIGMDDKNLVTLLTALYNGNRKETANIICENLTKLGYGFARDLFNKYNS
jgi:hypothetical protein